jgi:hypothetical protein
MPTPLHGEKSIRLMKGTMHPPHLQASEGNIARVITWLSILAMFVTFWIGMAGLAALLFLRGS